MKRRTYLTAPPATDKIPTGIPHIVGNEAAERFSFYGMRTILVIFMTEYLRNRCGDIAVLDETTAKTWYHQFLSWVYIFPLLGALLSDIFIGKYRTIIWLSIVYCAGHLALAIDETETGLAIGLGLIALGSGGIKPCVSAHVGDQFGKTNQHLLSKVFGWFYFSINVGSFVSTLLTPWLLARYGAHAAFGIPGLLMLLATVVFWMGRNRFVHIPPSGREFATEVLSGFGLKTLVKLGVVYLFIAVFFSVYDQSGSDWVLQAKEMDRQLLGFQWLPSQVQAVNPILVLIYIPLFSYGLYPAIERFFRLTALRKITIGFVLTIPVALLIAWLEARIAAGEKPTIAWHIVAYVMLTAAEVMIYQTGLEYSYTQSPKTMKSFVMSLYLLSIALGNQLTSLINFTIGYVEDSFGKSILQGPDYFLFFAAMMAVVTVLFVFVTPYIPDKTYLQDESSAETV